MLYIIRTGSTSWFQICIYFDLFKVTRGHQRSLKGQNRRIMVETEPISRNIFKIHVSTQNFVKNSNLKLFEAKSGHQKSSKVKFRSKRSNWGRIGSISRNIYNIHMFRLKILWRNQIQNYLRSIQVIRGQNRVKIDKYTWNQVD